MSRVKLRAGNSLIGFPCELLVFCEKLSEWVICSKKWAICSFLVSNLSDSLMVAHFWWVTQAICSPKKREWANRSFLKFKKTYIEPRKNMMLDFFSHNFEQIAHLSWATWGIRSRSLICLERSERIAHSRSFDLSKMSEWANERWANDRIPSPGIQIVSGYRLYKTLL